MAKRKDRDRRFYENKKMAVALAASLSTAPLAAGVVYGASDPATVSQLPNIVGKPGDSYVINLPQTFGRGHLSYSTNSSDPSKASIANNGGFLSVTLNEPGNAVITVTDLISNVTRQFQVNVIGLGSNNVSDIGDLVSYMHEHPQAFTDKEQLQAALSKIDAGSVPVNHAPSVNKAVYEMYLTSAQSSASLDLSQFFTDQDTDDFLTYSVSSNSVATGVNVSISGSTLQVNGYSDNEAGFEITATDRAGAASSSLLVVKPNHAPTVSQVTYTVYAPLGPINTSMNLYQLFHDSDGDSLNFTLQPSSQNGVSGSIAGDSLTFVGILAAPSRFWIVGDDRKGGTVTAQVYLDPYAKENVNGAPTVTKTTYTYNLPFNSVVPPVDVSGNFSDPDGDVLHYGVEPSSTGGLAAFMSGSLLTFSGSLTSSVTFNVYAEDRNGARAYASYSFNVPILQVPHVNNYAISGYSTPYSVDGLPTSENPIFNLSENFSPSNGGTLSYTISPDNGSNGLWPILNGTSLTFGGNMKTAADTSFTVTAWETAGSQKISNSAVYTVRLNHAPSVTESTYTVELPAGSTPDSVDLSTIFSDADSDAMVYEVELPTQAGLTASINGSTLSFTGALAESVTFNVYATDNKGGTARVQYQANMLGALVNPLVNDTSVVGYANKDLIGETPVTSYPTFDLTRNFTARNGGVLSFTATALNSAGLTPTIADGILSFNDTQAADTDALFKVTATETVDNRQASSEAYYTVRWNHAPTVTQSTYTLGIPADTNVVSVDIAGLFSDPDHDTLVYGVTPDSAGSMTASISGTTLTFSGTLLENDNVTFAVYADDNKGGRAVVNYQITTLDGPYVVEPELTKYGYLYNEIESVYQSFVPIDAAENFRPRFGGNLAYSITPQGDTHGLKAEIDPVSGWITFTNEFDNSTDSAVFAVTATETYGDRQLTSTAYYTIKAEYPPMAVTPSYVYPLDQGEAAPSTVFHLNELFKDADDSSLVYGIEHAIGSGSIQANLDGSNLSFAGSFDEPVTYYVYAEDPKGVRGYTEFIFKAPENLETVSSDVYGYEVVYNYPETVSAGVYGSAVYNNNGEYRYLPSFYLGENFVAKNGGNVTYTVSPAEGTNGVIPEFYYDGYLTFTGSLTSDSAAFTVTATETSLNGKSSSGTAVYHLGIDHAPSVTDYTYSQMTIVKGDPLPGPIDLGKLFTDSDSDPLTYGFYYKPDSGVSAEIKDGMLTFTGELTENVSIAVYAEDGKGGIASTGFYLQLLDNPVVKNTDVTGYETKNVYEGQDYYKLPDFYLNDNFESTDYGNLTFEVSPLDGENGLTPVISGSYLSFTGNLTASSASFIVTATEKASDGREVSSTATYTVLQNNAPSVTSDTYEIAVYKDESLPVTVDLNTIFSDVDGDNLSYQVSGYNEQVTAAVYGNLLTFTGTLLSSANFNVYAYDSKGGETSANIDLRYLDDPSVVQPEVTVYSNDGSIPYSVLLDDNFKASDQGPLTYEIATAYTGELQASESNGWMSFTGAMDADSVSFTVTAKETFEDHVFSKSATYTVVRNHSPETTVTGSVYDVYVVPDTAATDKMTLNLDDLFQDSDGDPLKYDVSFYSSNTNFTLGTDGDRKQYLTYQGTPTGAEYVTVTASDGKTGSYTPSLNIYFVPNYPVMTDASVSTDVYYPSANSEVLLNKKFYDFDKTDSLTYSVSGDSNGIHADIVNGTMTFTFTGSFSDWTQPATFTVTATDNKGPAAQATYTVYPNHAPSIGLADSYDVLDSGANVISAGDWITDSDNGDSVTYSLNVADPGTYSSGSMEWLALDSTQTGALDIGSFSAGDSPVSGKVDITATDSHGTTASKSVAFNNAVYSQLSQPSDKNMVTGSTLTMEDLYKRYSSLTNAATFVVRSSDSSVVDAQMSGGSLVLKANAAGNATIYVMGTDLSGSTYGIIDQFQVNVSDAVIDSLNTRVILPQFSNDGEDYGNLAYQFVGADGLAKVGTVGMDGDIYVYPIASGSYTVTITAATGSGSNTVYAVPFDIPLVLN